MSCEVFENFFGGTGGPAYALFLSPAGNPGLTGHCAPSCLRPPTPCTPQRHSCPTGDPPTPAEPGARWGGSSFGTKTALQKSGGPHQEDGLTALQQVSTGIPATPRFSCYRFRVSYECLISRCVTEAN